MGFGKKKKKKDAEREAKPVVQKVDMSHNPLYPPKQESEMKEIATAIGVAAVCLLLTGLIVSKCSYAYSTNNMASQRTVAVQEENQGTAEAENMTAEEENEVEDWDVSGQEEMDEQAETEVLESTEEQEEENKDYIIADSNSRRISTSELDGLSKEELSRARNEIYARHGRKFKDASLQEYFNSKDWYQGTIDPDQFTEGMLNDTEKANAETILSYEKSKGYK